MHAYALLLLTALAALVSPGHAWVYERCKLAHDLRDKYGFPANQIATLVCIAYQESVYETTAVAKNYTMDGSIGYGLYKISSPWWCDRGIGEGCGMTCDSLTLDMDKVMQCVKIVYKDTQAMTGDGFDAWPTYDFCKKPASYINNCDF